MKDRDLEINNELFSRERLAGYDPEIMKATRMLIVGAGALGQNTALNLALAGVGEIRNGMLEVPGSRQIPWVASPAKPVR